MESHALADRYNDISSLPAFCAMCWPIHPFSRNTRLLICETIPYVRSVRQWAFDISFLSLFLVSPFAHHHSLSIPESSPIFSQLMLPVAIHHTIPRAKLAQSDPRQ
jgi:hypothetical protein